MAEKEPDNDGPSLELPSLGFGRKRRRTHDPEPGSTGAAPGRTESAPAPAPEPGAEPTATPEPGAEPGPQPLVADEAPTPAAVEHADTAEQARRAWPPEVSGMTAAVVTGAVVGLLTVGLTWASTRLCELVRGTSSCGDPGFFLLLAIMIVMVLLGKLVLGALGVGDPGSTSLLGVGLVAVVALLFLINVLFEWWMAVVIPLVGVASFALSHWVTTSFAGPEPGDTRHR